MMQPTGPKISVRRLEGDCKNFSTLILNVPNAFLGVNNVNMHHTLEINVGTIWKLPEAKCHQQKPMIIIKLILGFWNLPDQPNNLRHCTQLVFFLQNWGLCGYHDQATKVFLPVPELTGRHLGSLCHMRLSTIHQPLQCSISWFMIFFKSSSVLTSDCHWHLGECVYL